ncbi:MAG: hypothetical protein J0L92_19620 [Deltaproteobacteria bacterium]|nr:hypothetical protein [Deltaproteobacteria bacterium]
MRQLGRIEAEQPALREWLAAYDILDIEDFTRRVLPPAWAGIRARILETGATMSATPCRWAPRWTQIPPTVRVGRTDDESRMRSIIYRVHDCLHQLWGLPHPGDLDSEEDFRDYKKAQMCGEIVVLTLCEFVYVKWLHESFPELRAWIDGRCAVPMTQSVMRGKSTLQIALRVEELLHKRWIARWARDDAATMAWVEYYTPMLEADRGMVDRCWAAMKAEPEWIRAGLVGAPKARFDRALTSLELTCWMVADFEHNLSTSPEPDRALLEWNRARRAAIALPSGWPV